MFIIFLLIGILVAYNARLAMRIGQNGILWGFITLVSYFLCQSFFGAILILIINKWKMIMPQEINSLLQKNPMAALAIVMFGVGGALLIRYILETMAKKKKTN
jgi:hypothetical protein